MALFRGVIRSSVLMMDTGLCVIRPHDRLSENVPEHQRVLYLLHGLGENCEAWTRYTAIERYARNYALTVIMPEVQRSFYLDMEYGLSYFTYLTDELPQLCLRMFGISTQREDTFVAGLSMGGYGAMKCGLTYPDRYAGCASFSGLMDFRHMTGQFLDDDQNRKQIQAGIGMELEVNDANMLDALAGKLIGLPDNERPEIFVSCGLDDFLHEENVQFNRHLKSLDIKHKYMEWPGTHEWDFWDESIRHALAYFFDD